MIRGNSCWLAPVTTTVLSPELPAASVFGASFLQRRRVPPRTSSAAIAGKQGKAASGRAHVVGSGGGVEMGRDGGRVSQDTRAIASPSTAQSSSTANGELAQSPSNDSTLRMSAKPTAAARMPAMAPVKPQAARSPGLAAPQAADESARGGEHQRDRAQPGLEAAGCLTVPAEASSRPAPADERPRGPVARESSDGQPAGPQ